MEGRERELPGWEEGEREICQLVGAEIQLSERRETGHFRREACQLIVAEIQVSERRQLAHLRREARQLVVGEI